MMQNTFMWSSTPATNSDKKKKKEKKDQERKPNHVIKGNITRSNPSMWTTPHVQPSSFVSDEPPSLAQQVDQKLRTIENQFAIASGYSLTSFPSTSTFRRHWVCKSSYKGNILQSFSKYISYFPCSFAFVNICHVNQTLYAGAVGNLHLRVQWANFAGFLILTGCISGAVQRLTGYHCSRWPFQSLIT